MAKVKILSEHVANQIAAGEVVERPMSVIKELLENAIDSGATRIKICFNDAGRSFISIEDNGCGMTREDAMTALERHATSKLETSSDLDNIHTFGFRGEALPSIASISRFCLKTRPSDQELGTEIAIHGGRYLYCRECGMSAGTLITVEGLFFNVPARLKFLKAASTESAHVTRVVRLYALAHPNIHFVLIADGKQVFMSPANIDLLDRVCKIWGNQLFADLMVLPPKEVPGMKLSGLLGKPGVSRASRQEIVTIVNGRPIDSRLMVNTLIESYHTLIPRARYPLAYLFLEIDPHAIDVNVHPAKREIRFRDESKVRNFIMVAILSALGLMRDETNAEKNESSAPQAIAFAGTPVIDAKPIAKTHFEPAKNNVPAPAKTILAPAIPVPVKSIPVPASAKRVPATDLQFKNWRYLGQMTNENVVLFQAHENLILFNIKYARERIIYERILRQFKSEKSMPSQQLLMPELIELPPLLSDLLTQSIKIFDGAGFEIELFGRDVFRIKSIPEWLGENEDPKIFVCDLLDRIQRFPVNYSRSNIATETLAKMACSRAGNKIEILDREKTLLLLTQLFECEQPNTSPRGFKIFAEISRDDIFSKFGLAN